ALAQHRVREPDHGCFANFAKSTEEPLDLAWLNAFSAAANQVSLPSDDDQIARFVIATQVSGSEPSICGPHFAGRGFIAEVARGAARPPSPDFTGFSHEYVVTGVVHDAKLRVPSRPAHGMKANLGGIFGRRHRPPSEVHRAVAREHDSRRAAL